MRNISNLRHLLSILLVMLGMTSAWADALPYLTTDAQNPILYRIKNTRRTAKGTANYWVMPNGLSTDKAAAEEVYFTGVKGSDYMRVKIHQKEGDKTLTADYTWGEGIDWYIKEFESAQGGGYTGVLISNASTFPNVTNDKMADDGLGCWYVGSNNTYPWLYGGQWDGSIFTLEMSDPNQATSTLIEIPQTQSPEISDGASRATMEKGEGYTTYTTKTDICVIVKMYDVDVKNCDYILFKFAEPIPSGIKAAFWKQGGTENVEIPAGSTEYKYVFAEDSKCAISNNVLPQITLLTIYAGSEKTVKLVGIYKHSNSIPGQEADPLVDATEELTTLINKAKPYVIGTGIGQYNGTDVAAIANDAEAYLTAGKCTIEKVNEYISQIKAGLKTLSINLPAAGAEFRLYNPAHKAYISAPTGATRMKMITNATEATVFTWDGKNLVGKKSGLYTATYNLNKEEGPDQIFIIEAYGNHPGKYTIEYIGGEKERCLQAEATGSECNRHYLSSQSGYDTSTQPYTAFEIQMVSGDVIATQNMTDKIENASFETGNLTGWVYSAVRGDVGAKPNSDGVYQCTGTDGDYLFNTWITSDSRKGTIQDHCAYQTLYDLPVGEYRLEVQAASNQSTAMTLFANSFTYNMVPRSKSVLTEHRLGGIYVTPETKSLVVGVRSQCWFKCDNFRLTYLGKTKGYEDYVQQGMADASIMNPVILDYFDGRTTEGFTYSAGSLSSEGGAQNDGTQVDMSKLQAYTKSGDLSDGTISTTYSDIPNGYYKVSATVRVYDLDGTVNKPAKGLTLYAGESETAITKGTAPTAGDNKAKGFCDEYAVVTKISDGKLEAGFKLDNCSFNWLGWQGFRLEYLGTNDPTDMILNLNLPEGQFVALCVPYEITPEYFGDFYKVVEVTKDGKAQVVPNTEKTLAAGTPTVVLANGKNPEVTINNIQISNAAPRQVLTYWNNTLLQGTYEGFTWNADLSDRTVLEGNKLQFNVLDYSNINASITQMNRAAERFWAENADYTTSSASTIYNYLNEPTMYRRDQPNAIIIPCEYSAKSRRLFYNTDPTFESGTKNISIAAKSDHAELTNLLPNTTYYYYIGTASAKEQEGQFTVTGDLRMILVGDNVYNCRDLGGKITEDGRMVKYGKIFRSGEENGGYVATSDELTLMKKLGIGAEIDLRGEIDNSGKGGGTSAFGFVKGKTYYYVGGDHYIADEATKMANGDEEAIKYWSEELPFAFNNLIAGKGLNFHCRIGADRTGCLGMLLEGLLGVQENDLIRDYETTSFSTAAGTRVKSNTFDTGLKFIKGKIPAGGTLRDGFEKYATETLKVDKSLIEQYREVMLEEPVSTVIQDIIYSPMNTSNEMYDLAGRKLSKAMPGIMIVNGKKILVK